MMRMKNIMGVGAVVVVFLTAMIGVIFSSKAALGDNFSGFNFFTVNS